MKKNYLFLKVCLAVMLITGVFGSKAKATVWPIPNTAVDTLQGLIERNNDLLSNDDTIMLISSGLYNELGTIDMFKGLTIMGDPKLSARPVVQFQDNGFRPKEDTISITIKNINFNGNKDGGGNAGAVLRFDLGSTYWKNVILEDLEVWGTIQLLDLAKNKHTVYDTVIVNNVVCHDFASSTQFCIDPRLNYVKYLSVTNSTFYNLPCGFLKNPDYNGDGTLDITKEWVVDHNTFYKVGANDRALIQINDPIDGSVDFTFTNNIVSKLYDKMYTKPFMLNELAGDYAFAYSVINDYDAQYETFMVYNFDSIAKLPNVDTSFIYTDDPLFVDTTFYNFTISAGNPLLTAGSDGGPIGDPRWVSYIEPWEPGPHSWLIPNTQEDTLQGLIERNNDLLSDGDTIVLVSGGLYNELGTIDMFKGLTIMGDPRLSTRPVVQFQDNGFRPKEDTISITIKNINFNGNKDGGGNAGAVLRFDLGSTYWKNVILEDLEVWGTIQLLDLAKNKHTVYDTVIVNNVICHDFASSTQFCIDPRLNYVKYLSVTNSTFYNLPCGFLKNPDYNGDGTLDITKEWVVDHNTFYKVGANDRALIQINDPIDGSVDFTFTNNIVSKLYDKMYTKPFILSELAGDYVFAYSVINDYDAQYETFMVYNFDSIAKLPNVDTSFIYKVDPMFADTTANDFTIPDTSPLYQAATDGGAIGDPRWAPLASGKVISITPVLTKVIENNDMQMEVTVDLPDGVDKTVTWSVMNGYGGTSGDATIDPSTGVLSPTTAGDVKVTATSNYNTAFFDTLIITIEQQIFVSSITLSGPTLIDNPGGFITISAAIEPANADNKTITWSLNDASLATITEKTPTTAELVAKKCGIVTVTATSQDGSDVSDLIDVTITKQIRVDSISVEGENSVSEITVSGGTLQMITTIYPANACIQEVDWSVDNESIATIDSDGILTAVSNGTVTVTATSKDNRYITYTADITITNQSTGIDGTLADELQVVPNPASNFIYIKSNEIADVEIRNIVGSVIMKMTIDPNDPIDINELKSGIYFVHVKAGNSSSLVKLIKK